MKKSKVKRWRCGDCGAIFNKPTFRHVPDADDPTIPRALRQPGIPVLYTCPDCDSGNVRGMANPDPFTPIQASPDK